MDSILDNYHYMPTSLTDSTGLPIMRCVPKMETNVIMVYGMGNTTKVIYRPTCIAPGVDTHYVHNYNVASGWALPDERTQDERQAESIRTSVSRSIRAVRELAACNPWQFFVTITLSPQLWKIATPQTVCKILSKLWPSVGVESARMALHTVPVSHIYSFRKCTRTVQFIYTVLCLACLPRIASHIQCQTSTARKNFQ